MHYDAAKAILNASKILRSGKSSDIPFTNEFKEKNQDLIIYYKGLSNNKDFHLILEDIKSDLEKYTNKSNAEIWSMLN